MVIMVVDDGDNGGNDGGDDVKDCGFSILLSCETFPFIHSSFMQILSSLRSSGGKSRQSGLGHAGGSPDICPLVGDAGLGMGGEFWVHQVWEWLEKEFRLPALCPGQGWCPLRVFRNPIQLAGR